jgi:glycosyltransferase involved in cell wall biosynthesis
LIADSPADIAAAVARLLEWPEEAARLARAGRALVETRYDWRTALGGLDTIYTDRPGTAVTAKSVPQIDAPSRNA